MVSLQALALVAALYGVGETVLLEFTADSCVHCRNMESTVKRLQVDGYPVRQINVTHSPLWTEQYRVQGVPCFVMLANGQIVDRVEGFTSHSRLVRMFEAAGFKPGGTGASQARSQSPDAASGGFRLPDLVSRNRGDSEAREASPSSGNAGQTGTTRAVAQGAPQTDTPANVGLRVTPEQLALNATVRLRVEDSQGYSFGTGTIIDTHGDEALVITCGHIFRDSGGKGRITVDLFASPTPRSVPGQLVDYDATTNDIGLVSIRPGVKVAPAPVAPSNYQPSAGVSVFSIGCNNGRPPSLARSQITSVNRYLGPANIEVAGMPINGRSGGGLFTSDGMLVGICNAADEQDDEGIYAALGVIHEKLAEIGQSRIFDRSEISLADRTGGALHPRNPQSEALSPASIASVSATRENTSPPSSAASSSEVEVICIVRSRGNPHGTAETIVLDRPSGDFLHQLQRERASQAFESTPSHIGTLPQIAADERVRPLPRDMQNAGPVVRGQSRDN